MPAGGGLSGKRETPDPSAERDGRRPAREGGRDGRRRLGNNAWDPDWIDAIIEAITGGEEPWPDIYCLGTTGGGSPKHPTARGKHRVPDDQQPVLWRNAQ